MSKFNISFLFLMAGFFLYSCQNQQITPKEVSAPQADFYKSIGITKSDSIVKDIVDLKGNYRLYAENNAFEVDITIEFKEGNESVWHTKIGEHSDKIIKKYEIFADAIYLTHDLEVMKDALDKIRADGAKGMADLMENMAAQVPEIDKFKIKLLTNDTIQLIGARRTINLLKID